MVGEARSGEQDDLMLRGKPEVNKECVREKAAAWSRLLREKGFPHMVIGSVAMLLHGCDLDRNTIKDIDFLVPTDRAEEMKCLLVEKGFVLGKNGNYENGDVTLGIATPKTHCGLPIPADDTASTTIGDVRVLKLEGLIEAKRLAVESLMKKIAKRGYRRCREQSAAKHMKDFFALCRYLANQRGESTSRKA